ARSQARVSRNLCSSCAPAAGTARAGPGIGFNTAVRQAAQVHGTPYTHGGTRVPICAFQVREHRVPVRVPRPDSGTRAFVARVDRVGFRYASRRVPTPPVPARP